MSDAPEFSFELAKKKRQRRLLLAGVAIPLVAGSLFAARPVYHALKGWRARQLAAQAERLMSEKKWSEAGEKAQGAFLMGPGEPKAIRAVAKLQTEAGLPGALQFWQALIDTGRATPADRRDYVGSALRAGALGQAHAELARLTAQDPNQAANLWLLSRLCLAQGDVSAAQRFASAALATAPTNRAYRLFAASLAFSSSQPEAQANARTTVWTLARQPDEVGLQALEFLAGRRERAADQTQELVDLLQKHPLRTMAHRLLALSLKLGLQPEQRSRVFEAATLEFKGAPPADRREFGVWLNQQREFQRTLALIPFEDARKRTDLFIVHLDALASLGHWQDIEAILNHQAAPLSAVYLEAFKARCALQLKNPALAALSWNRALAAAENQFEELWWLADYAGKNGALEPARRAYRAWIGRAREPRPGYQALTRLVEQTGTTAELRDLLGDMLKRWPEEPALRNDHAYLSLLLGEAPAPFLRTAEELVAVNPGSLPHRTTLALARYRLNDFAGALRAYAGQDYDWSLALPGHRAVYAAVLAANQSTEPARRLVRGLPLPALRQEEQALIQPLL